MPGYCNDNGSVINGIPTNAPAVKATTPTLPNSVLFEPMYCWYEGGKYTDFFSSRAQVGMCHDFNEKDPHIIEVDVRMATCLEDASHVGILHKDGKISCVFEHPVFLSSCGPRESWIPVNITDMRTLGVKRLAGPRIKITEGNSICCSE